MNKLQQKQKKPEILGQSRNEQNKVTYILQSFVIIILLSNKS